MNLKKDHFQDRAKDWDNVGKRVDNARNIARGILTHIELKANEHLMDFGAGTGLLSENIADKVGKITAIDFSAAMLEEFASKSWPCQVEVLNIDLSEANLDYEFDGIISSMTLHHIEDIPNILGKFYKLLKPGGFIALADLEKEKGDFHNNHAGVYHFGFDPEKFRSLLEKIGFQSVKTNQVHIIQKETGSGKKPFPIFLATGRK